MARESLNKFDLKFSSLNKVSFLFMIQYKPIRSKAQQTHQSALQVKQYNTCPLEKLSRHIKVSYKLNGH